MISISGCGRLENDLTISLEENNCKIVFFNLDRIPVRIIKVDKELDFPGKKCDYYLVSVNYQIEHFVELKSSKVKKAVEQLENSIINISSDVKTFDKCAYIVCKGLKPKFKPKIQVNQKKFRESFNCNLVYGENCLEADIHSCEDIS